jgi:signal transduction histidine kinase
VSDSGPWGLFPYPTVWGGVVTDGSLVPAHPDCLRCPSRTCTSDSASRNEVRICRYGLAYRQLDEERTVVGLAVSDLSNLTQRARKRLRNEPERRVTSAQIGSAVARAHALGVGFVKTFERDKAQLLKNLNEDPQLLKAVAEQLRHEFSDNLEQSHDFLQLVQLVKGHAEVLLKDKYPNLEPAEAADRLPTEGAIYYSTEMMLAKMDSLEFLNEINLAHGGERRFKIHPLIVKYVRIYGWQAQQKDLRIRLEGSSHSESLYNPRAIGAVVQGLLDNLVKYAPASSVATVTFSETPSSVKISFDSVGPTIDPDERASIFLPKYRGRAARDIEMSGRGVGLATAKQISDALHLNLGVEQEEEADPRFYGRFRTSFSIILSRRL